MTAPARTTGAALVVAMTVLAACAGARSVSNSTHERGLAMTCWRLSGHGLKDDPFWAAPVRLDTATGLLAPPGGACRVLVRLERIDPAQILRTYASTWTVNGPDSVALFNTAALFSTHVRVRVHGNRLRGWSRTDVHVISGNGFSPAPTHRVTGVRIPCPANPDGSAGIN